MATTNQHSGLPVERNDLTGNGLSADEKPTLPAPPMRKGSSIVVLSCLLVATAGSAAIAQWMAPQMVAAEARREGSGREAFTSTEAFASNRFDLADSVIDPWAASLILNRNPPAVDEVLAVAEGEYEVVRETPKPKRKVRESDALVRDGHRLLMQHPALAKQLFDVAIAIDARNPHAHAGRAHALRRLHKPLEARAAIEQALRIRPKRAHYHALLAVLDAESPRTGSEHGDEQERAN